MLNEKILIENLNEKINLKIFDSIDSTNTYAKLNGDILADKTLVIAATQTAGRGRLGRTFISPEESGIYMSLILKEQTVPKDAVLLTTAAAVAVSLAIERLTGKKTNIKWVNDILINSKKVCGILSEAVFNSEGKLLLAVVGIGINAFTPKGDFDEQIKDIAGSVFDSKAENLRELLAAEVINNMLYLLKNLHDEKIFKEYKKRCIAIGKSVDIISCGKIIESGIVLDLERDFSLKIKKESGEIISLKTGEISIKIKELP